MKIFLLMIGFILWRKFLIGLIGSEATCGVFIIQAIYCRFAHCKDTQIAKVLYPEVIVNGLGHV